jgi:tyrosinase
VDVRRNIYNLTPAAVTQLTSALNTLKSNGTYDMFIHRHHDAMMHASLMTNETGTLRNSAHRGPAFGPWHRWYLRDLELQLQTVTPGLTLPYWSWSADAALASPTAAPLWSASYIGGDGAGPNDLVPNGPFKNWMALVMTPSMTLVPRAVPGIIRRLGRDAQGAPTLPRALDVTNSFSESAYDSAPWSESQTSAPSFRNRLEGWLLRPGDQTPNGRMHNRVHLWVGGDMLPGTSPNDPVFFLHHANVDRLWAQWQATHPTVPYAPAAGGPPGHNLNDGMFDLGVPGITPASTLDHHCMGYMYDDESPGQSADACPPNAVMTVSPGQLAQISTCFTNTGTTSWIKGTAGQVNLGQVCPQAAIAAWNSNWLSPTTYASTTQAVVAPGQTAFFLFSIVPPVGTAPGQYVIEGDLIAASTGRPLTAPTFKQIVNVQ